MQGTGIATRWRIAAMAFAVAVLGLAVWWVAMDRSGKYDDIADLYHTYAQGYEPPTNSVISIVSCYGTAWDNHTQGVWRDIEAHQGDSLYRRMRAHQYRQLSERYRRAASRPWQSLPPDPPGRKPVSEARP